MEGEAVKQPSSCDELSRDSRRRALARYAEQEVGPARGSVQNNI
ncbi:hypothetical protein A2U01_0060596 [Trifolium medium]|uniref:Uncharacterized protein n=1 Tax=Trifolium medium TaxID=97028 RepID=A0A392RUU0_9FABA|nr:hypothetical protein [Trifolium medium]